MTPMTTRVEDAVFVEAPARLQVIVDKTAGPAEHEAMTVISDYVRTAPRASTEGGP